jgi:hypothetical protein
MTKRTTHHVVKNTTGGWSVKKGGSDRVSGKFKTQKEAISSARIISKNQKSELVIQGSGRDTCKKLSQENLLQYFQ